MLKRWKQVGYAKNEAFRNLSYFDTVRVFFNQDNYTSSLSGFPYFYGTEEEVANCEFHTGMVFEEC